MKIWRHLQPDHIFLDVFLPDKETVLHFIADTCHSLGIVNDAKGLYEGLKHRENTMSTGIGDGIGLPHAVCIEVDTASILIIRLTDPIDFDSIDRRPVDIILALIIPENSTVLHIQLLAGISRLCRRKEFFSSIREASTAQMLLNTIQQVEDSLSFH